MTELKNIKRSEFYFDLDDKFIAKYPLAVRDESKLLVYKNSNIVISEFNKLPEFLDKDHLLVFNEAKVIPARLFFRRQTGALIEVLLLEPTQPANYEQVFKSSTPVQWKCIIGNLKKWKDDEVLICEISNDLELRAVLVNREERKVELSWNSQQHFLDILEKAGNLPIPPYLNRDTEESDYSDYQTIFAQNDGSVAAPTAALHFTNNVLNDLSAKGIDKCNLTLHVGAGTFLPVKHDNVIDHPMHREMFEISKESLLNLIRNEKRVAVGTTSLRVLESLYYIGLQIKERGHYSCVEKLEPYQTSSNLSYEQALLEIVNHLEKNNLNILYAATEILILPEYKLKSIKALITNFHLPESTLLMLVSSAVGEKWKPIYEKAKAEKFRFLSYGDSSLLFVD